MRIALTTSPMTRKLLIVAAFLAAIMIGANLYNGHEDIEFSDFTWNRNIDSLPYFGFGIRNLGEREITAVRVELDGSLLPWSFGVDRDEPIKPSRSGVDGVFTAWYDPEVGGLTGLYPEDGTTYPVKIRLRYDDGTTQTFDRRVKAEEGLDVASIAAFERLPLPDASMFRLGTGEGGVLSLSFRNTWYLDAPQTVEEVWVYVNSSEVMDSGQRVRSADYWAASIPLPFDVYVGGRYNVTLVAASVQGNVSKTTRCVTCEDLEIG